MNQIQQNITLTDILALLENAKKETIEFVYDWLKKENILETNDKNVKYCWDDDSLMNTKPLYLEGFPFKRDELYER